MPDTTQRNSKECCIWTCSHVHAGKAMTISENNGKCRWYLQSKNRQIRWQKDKELSGGVFLKKRKTILLLMKGHAVTLQILFLREISLWWKVEKPFSSLIFWKHGAVNKLYGAIDISYQIRGAEFPEKPKLLYSGTCTSKSTRHVNLNLLSCYSFLIVNCAIMIINNQIVD